jgi:hypothetical protein
MLVACSCASLSAQPNKQRQALDTEITLTGFLTTGGIVNLAEGDVVCECGAAAAQSLNAKQKLKNGNTIRVENGRAEVLLNPGYYLRIDANTQVAFLDLSPNNLKIKILSGSVIIEVSLNQFLAGYFPDKTMEIQRYEPVTVVTPLDEYAITEGGVYRFDVRADGASDLKVLKGVAIVAGSRIDKGKMASVRDGTVAAMKYGRDNEDAFDKWSRARATKLIRANKSLENTQWYKALSSNRLSYLTIMEASLAEMARDEYTVSARVGIVSFVEDDVTHRAGTDGKRLQKGDVLQYGDGIKTGKNSRAEILLYPTCSVHLSNDTEVLYLEKAGGGVALKLIKGSAIITTALPLNNEKLLSFSSPHAKFEIVHRGVYRFNVLPDGDSELLVYDGKITVVGNEIRKTKKAIFRTTGSVVYSSFKNEQDSFDVWSRKRKSILFRSREQKGWYFSRIEIAQYSGMWYLLPALGEYTFVPGLWDSSSSYGGSYSIKFRTELLPRVNY